MNQPDVTRPSPSGWCLAMILGYMHCMKRLQDCSIHVVQHLYFKLPLFMGIDLTYLMVTTVMVWFANLSGFLSWKC